MKFFCYLDNIIALTKIFFSKLEQKMYNKSLVFFFEKILSKELVYYSKTNTSSSKFSSKL